MVTTAATAEVVPHPSAPQSVEEAGIGLDLVVQLILKSLHFAGELTGSELCRRLGLTFPVIEPALELLKTQRHCEIVGGGIVGGASYRYRITDDGRTLAALFLEQSQYVGVAPVPLAQYQRTWRAYRGTVPPAGSRDAVRQRVLSSGDQRCRARSDRPGHQRRPFDVRLWPSGQRQDRHCAGHPQPADGEIAIPHAIEVEGSIIRVFDPVNHEAIGRRDEDQTASTADATQGSALGALPAADGDGRRRADARCARPELQPATGFYRAPVQRSPTAACW